MNINNACNVHRDSGLNYGNAIAAQAGPASEQSSNSSTAYGTAQPAGYVHSGYQAALQGPISDISTLQSNHWSRNASSAVATNYTPNAIRNCKPLRYGPGGPIRCSYPGCSYSGYTKDVEVHRMDRHLIFPPGYKAKKGPPDGEIGLVFFS